jgi:hypothetical protein
MTQETWYVLEDGKSVHPDEVAPNEAGALVHKSGVAVAMKGQVPHTRGVYPDQERAKTAPTKDMKPEDQKRTYRTRETKAD